MLFRSVYGTIPNLRFIQDKINFDDGIFIWIVEILAEYPYHPKVIIRDQSILLL
jgi:hypothetical protein